jgi:UPF0716 protein FxsA
MPLLILLIFIALPIAEIAVLIKVSDAITLLPTLALIILTAVLGVALLRQQGLSSIARAQQTLAEGRLPVDSVVDAVALVISGAFLLTPGLITDTLGFLLLIPAFRHGLARLMIDKAKKSDNIHVDMFGMGMGSDSESNTDARQSHRRPPFGTDRPSRGQKDGPVIDGEAVEIDDDGPASGSGRGSDDPSPWNR